MPIKEKILFSSIVIVVCITFMFLNKTKIKAGMSWKLGKKDPVRNLLFTKEGDLRKYSKTGICLWFITVLAFIWLMPTS